MTKSTTALRTLPVCPWRLSMQQSIYFFSNRNNASTFLTTISNVDGLSFGTRRMLAAADDKLWFVVGVSPSSSSDDVDDEDSRDDDASGASGSSACINATPDVSSSSPPPTSGFSHASVVARLAGEAAASSSSSFELGCRRFIGALPANETRETRITKASIEDTETRQKNCGRFKSH